MKQRTKQKNNKKESNEIENKCTLEKVNKAKFWSLKRLIKMN